MNAKILSIIGLLILAVGVWFFYKEDVKVEPAVPSAPQASYEVTEIKAVQTNEQTGDVEYTLTADSLVKNTQGEDEMVNAKMDWSPPDGEQFQLTASRATLDQAAGDMKLAEGFVLTKKGTDAKPDMVIKGTLLTGNTKTYHVQSDEPINVTQGEDSFSAKGFSANIQKGEYEFNKISIQFNPPERQDKPLF